MNQKDWVSYFKAAYGRDPEPQEFANALNKGEFTIDTNDEGNTSAFNSSQNNLNQQVSQIAPTAKPDVRMLKKDIQGSEDALIAKFAELGLEVYLQQINKKSESLENRIGQIIELNKVLYGLKAAYNGAVQSGRICLSCGTSLGENDHFCSNCGSDTLALEKAAKENIQICPLCDTEQDAKHLHCACCGLQF